MVRSVGNAMSAISRSTRLMSCLCSMHSCCALCLLNSSQVDVQTLRQAFNRLFLALPSFVERYPDISDVVRALYFPPRGDGMFAFVEFVDDVITTTAVQAGIKSSTPMYY